MSDLMQKIMTTDLNEIRDLMKFSGSPEIQEELFKMYNSDPEKWGPLLAKHNMQQYITWQMHSNATIAI